MRSIFVAFSAAILALTLGSTFANAEKVRCSSIWDSALCTAEPGCWYDAAGGNGCQEGPPPAEDGCAVHGSESVCNTSTLNCAWNAAESKCASKGKAE